MSDPAVSTFLAKVLCSRGGRLPRSLLPIFLKLSTEQIEQILQDEPEKFPQAGEMVLAQSPVRTCDKYLENIQEEECDKLHLCRNYLQGKCWPNIRPRCPFSHDVLSDQNQKVLKANEISGLNEDEIKVLLLQNDNQLLPGVCEKYLGDLCDLGKDCSRLHICGSFICGQCGGGDCRRSHDLLEFSSDLLHSRCHFPGLSIKNFQTLCAVKHNGRLQSLMVKEKPENEEEEETPTALSGPRKRKNSADVSQNKGHRRLQETADFNSNSGSGSRPMSTSEESHYHSRATTDDEKPVKFFIGQDLSSPKVAHPLTPLEVAQPLTSPEVAQPLTSPEVAQPLMSPEVPHLLTSPEAAHRLTSPEVAHLLTSPEVAHLLTSPEVAHLLTSPEVAHLLMSPEVAHPLTVPSVMDYHNYSISLAVTSPEVSSAPHNECTLTQHNKSRPTDPGLPLDTDPANPDKVPEICLSNLWKYCKLEGRCPDMHYYLPYRWQINKGTDWKDISNMEAIEKCYCDPSADRVQSIDFLTMRSSEHSIRRLSTVSSVMKPPEYVLTTEWLWYWKDENSAWTQYGHSNVKKVKATASTSDLENVYLTDPTAVLPFIAGKHHYEINFQEMKQRNINYETERDVRRRPKYLSFQDVKLLRGSTKSSAPQPPLESAAVFPLRTAPPPLKTDIYPKTWNTSALPEIGCKKVLVSERSSEFLEIVSSFAKTVSGHVVKKLWRLQNPFLWQVFQQQKKQMKKLNKGRDVKEMRLFHGTKNKHIEAICNQNFDWRLCGTHGTRYGQGSYFARDASYSHNFCTAAVSGKLMMFLARVLVGDYMEGTSEMKRPPLKPGSSSRYYDSSVDNITDPSIFVVFEKHQIYPEYLLEYEEQK